MKIHIYLFYSQGKSLFYFLSYYPTTIAKNRWYHWFIAWYDCVFYPTTIAFILPQNQKKPP